MNSGLRVVAVIVTYDRPRELQLVVEALSVQTRRPDDIIVLDNASARPAAETLAGREGIAIRRSPDNLGGAGGFALGIEAALERRPDWIWLMDDDAVPRPDALERLLDALPRLPVKSGALGSAVYEDDLIATPHRRYFSRRMGRERPISAARYLEAAIEIDTASFVGFLVRADAVREVGLPDESFFIAYDDTDYSLRLKKAGWRLWLVPGSGIDHLRSLASRLRTSPFGARHYFNIRNRIVIARRYGALPLLSGLRASAIGMALFLVAPDARKASGLRLLVRAVRDGWRGTTKERP